MNVLRRLQEDDRPVLEFSSYLFAAARHESYALMRQRVRTHPTDSPPAERGRVADVETDPERSALLHDSQQSVRDANAQLPPRHREVLALREVAGRSYEEIGATMGISENAAAQLIFRARSKLREAMTAGERSRPWSRPRTNARRRRSCSAEFRTASLSRRRIAPGSKTTSTNAARARPPTACCSRSAPPYRLCAARGPARGNAHGDARAGRRSRGSGLEPRAGAWEGKRRLIRRGTGAGAGGAAAGAVAVVAAAVVAVAGVGAFTLLRDDDAAPADRAAKAASVRRCLPRRARPPARAMTRRRPRAGSSSRREPRVSWDTRLVALPAELPVLPFNEAAAPDTENTPPDSGPPQDRNGADRTGRDRQGSPRTAPDSRPETVLDQTRPRHPS